MTDHYQIIVAGNHDILLQRARHCTKISEAGKEVLDWGDCIYLENEAKTITCTNGRQLKIYGSPLSPRHGNWPFQYPRTKDIWSETVPDDTDIVITHGPPFGHLDLNFGCHHLLREIWRVRPLLHIFGHIHEGYGHEWTVFDGLQKAYERVLAKGGVLNLLVVLKEMLVSFCRAESVAACQLVNPAIMGGIRDDERRQPVTVVL